ncbi:hypothetical protein PVAP13_7KG342270 [Panicum virgatum]|uniref:Uncharacterized protein n=1 Tax=Panicum virgatum TaxID=38727 RepID=A0A8T0QMZ5_PANVG|nr:hypothetical protein PVAP13_7KG342270 [Panicum virgatum]
MGLLVVVLLTELQLRSMASITNLSRAAVVALLFGLLVVGAVGVDECGFLCVDGTYVTCANYPGQQFPGVQLRVRAVGWPGLRRPQPRWLRRRGLPRMNDDASMPSM